MQEIVCCVDNVGNGPQPECGESQRQPFRAWPHLETTNDNPHVTRAAVGVVELHVRAPASRAVGVAHGLPACRGNPAVHPVAEAEFTGRGVKFEEFRRIA